jgi:drug/metabolite transporter (DMT)-like permease
MICVNLFKYRKCLPTHNYFYSYIYFRGGICNNSMTIFGRSVEYFSPVGTIMIAEIGNVILGWSLLIAKWRNIKYQLQALSAKIWRDIWLVLFCSLFGVFFFAKAFETGSLSFESAITACSPAITTLFALVFLNKKLSYVQYVAIFVLVLGISGLSYVSL